MRPIMEADDHSSDAASSRGRTPSSPPLRTTASLPDASVPNSMSDLLADVQQLEKEGQEEKEAQKIQAASATTTADVQPQKPHRADKQRLRHSDMLRPAQHSHAKLRRTASNWNANAAPAVRSSVATTQRPMRSCHCPPAPWQPHKPNERAAKEQQLQMFEQLTRYPRRSAAPSEGTLRERSIKLKLRRD